MDRHCDTGPDRAPCEAAEQRETQAGEDPMPLDELETQIAELAAHLYAGTYRWLCLLREFDEREGWGGWGVMSCAHWLNWKCGLGMCAAREHLRVAHALARLPRVSAAFERGEISYSKARAITRVGDAHNEEYLLGIAQCGTASHLERLVRTYRRVRRAEELGREAHQQETRALHYYYDDDGSLVIRARLPGEHGALLIESLWAAMAVQREERWQAQHSGADGAGDAFGDEFSDGFVDVSAEVADRADVPVAVDGAGAGSEGSADVSAVSCFEVREPTPDVSAEFSTPVGGSGSSEGQALDRGRDAAPTVERNTSAGPLHYDEVETPYSAGDSAGAEKSEDYAALRADALVMLAESFLAHGAVAVPGGERCEVRVHVDAHVLAAGEGEGRCELEDGPWVAAETARRLACDASVVHFTEDAQGEPLNVGRRTRSIPPALRRALQVRDGGCRFPGCTRRRYVDGHHVRHWAEGGETRLDNLVHLCRYHHRLVHEGGFTVERTDDGEFTFGRPDGEPIDAVPGGPCLRPGDDLAAINRRLGLSVNPDTCVPGWYGERMDLALAMDGMYACADRAARERLHGSGLHDAAV